MYVNEWVIIFDPYIVERKLISFDMYDGTTSSTLLIK